MNHCILIYKSWSFSTFLSWMSFQRRMLNRGSLKILLTEEKGSGRVIAWGGQMSRTWSRDERSYNLAFLDSFHHHHFIIIDSSCLDTAYHLA
jgi:hypothetical protein